MDALPPGAGDRDTHTLRVRSTKLSDAVSASSSTSGPRHDTRWYLEARQPPAKPVSGDLWSEEHLGPGPGVPTHWPGNRTINRPGHTWRGHPHSPGELRPGAGPQQSASHLLARDCATRCSRIDLPRCAFHSTVARSPVRNGRGLVLSLTAKAPGRAPGRAACADTARMMLGKRSRWCRSASPAALADASETQTPAHVRCC